ANEASELAGVEVTQGGLFFPQAGWINPRALCDYLVDHPNVNIIYDFHVSEINQTDDGWLVNAEKKRATRKASVVVIANAKDSLSFTQTNHLPVKTIRGQVTHLPSSKNLSLKTVVCAEGYIAPSSGGLFCTGATFNLHSIDTQIRTEDHQTNLNNLHQHLPAIAKNWSEIDAAELAGRVGFRCSLPDYLPVVGPLPLVEKMVEDFAPLRKNAKAAITCPGTYLPGLYINTGHGARGLTYTPLCAELLAAHINDELLPIPMELANALNPARFVIRDLTRNKR
ncbi:MAG: FAD-dependent oxidoreductase, partial [Moraxellaceae bacterium]